MALNYGKYEVIIMPGKLLVKRKGFTRSDGTKVKPASFLIQDIGRPGRGPDTIKLRREGFMTSFAKHRGFLKQGQKVTDMPDVRIKQMAIALAEVIGPRKALGMFSAQVNFRTRARGERLANRRKFETGKEAIQQRFFPKS
jgi:hypothetical protein